MSKREDNGLAMVLSRNGFYRDAYRRVVLILLVLFVVNCGLAGAIVYKFLNPPPAQYFAATPDGRIINIHKLTDPVVSDKFVLQWTADAVRAAFSEDYVHWRKQLQDASVNFTADGWKNFLKAFKSSNNLKTLLNMKMVSDAKLTGSPEIVAQTKVDGHWAWKVEMPLLVTYTDGKQNTINMPWKVIVIVIRMPVKDYPQRIAINNFIPQTGS